MLLFAAAISNAVAPLGLALLSGAPDLHEELVLDGLLPSAPPAVPAQYAAFKGALLARRVDAEFARLLPHGSRFDGRLDQLHFGGVGPRGIPALTDPAFVSAADAAHVADDAPVVGLSIAGDARAYPLRIIDWHEMVNDVVGGTPVALTWCTLCNAAIPYRARTAEGQRIVFGSSGLLLCSNKVMFDEETGSLWGQLPGRRLTRRELGAEPLDRLPVRMTTWRRWRDEHPKTLVLSAETGHIREYAVEAAYGDAFTSGVTMFPVAAPDADLSLAVKDAVVVIEGAEDDVAPVDVERRPLDRHAVRARVGIGRAARARSVPLRVRLRCAASPLTASPITRAATPAPARAPGPSAPVRGTRTRCARADRRPASPGSARRRSRR